MKKNKTTLYAGYRELNAQSLTSVADDLSDRPRSLKVIFVRLCIYFIQSFDK